ncbi:hypothetical protein PLESTB_001632600 [Pleodorina starrii]|uniref:Uncharacterized protein n=1 Tax=Pleodorina starrii TaxID=330485 RepID=A0A9W6F9G0_9CHLO|nr:hypothetical protein PLESTB_001632600 [Pleodorina starrii]
MGVATVSSGLKTKPLYPPPTPPCGVCAARSLARSLPRRQTETQGHIAPASLRTAAHAVRTVHAVRAVQVATSATRIGGTPLCHGEARRLVSCCCCFLTGPPPPPPAVAAAAAAAAAAAPPPPLVSSAATRNASSLDMPVMCDRRSPYRSLPPPP